MLLELVELNQLADAGQVLGEGDFIEENLERPQLAIRELNADNPLQLHVDDFDGALTLRLSGALKCAPEQLDGESLLVIALSLKQHEGEREGVLEVELHVNSKGSGPLAVLSHVGAEIFRKQRHRRYSFRAICADKVVLY